MEKILKCSRCHEEYIQTRRSRMGQICPWCEECIIDVERELSRKCGISPMTMRDITVLNQYWQEMKAR